MLKFEEVSCSRELWKVSMGENFAHIQVCSLRFNMYKVSQVLLTPRKANLAELDK